MNYDEYMLSEHWRKLRLRALKRDRFRCRLCGGREALQVHHLRYGPDLHRVPLGWLMTLCGLCHGAVHCYMEGEGGFLRKLKPGVARAHLLQIFSVSATAPPPEPHPAPMKPDAAAKTKKPKRKGFYARNRRPKDHWR